jgi:hypothetical protein
MALIRSTRPAGRARGHWASCTRLGVHAGAVVSLSNGAVVSLSNGAVVSLSNGAGAETRPPPVLEHAPPSWPVVPPLFCSPPFSVRTINCTHLFAAKDLYALVVAIGSPTAALRPTSRVLSSSVRAFPN